MSVIEAAKNLGLYDEKILMPNPRQIEWYNREKMIFFHFGMNTFTGKEWGDGSESPALFNPTQLDVDSWIRIIKDAGFKCAILTAKHHDGFCLWQTKYTEHSIKNSPFKSGKGDIVKEFTDACRRHGIKAGIYLSPWDRHEPSWGKDEYNDFYAGQLTELLSNYGKIWEVWWDGAGSTEAVYDWDRWASVVRTLQPDAVIFGSLGATPYVDVRWVGNEKGVAGKPCYSTVDAHTLVVETISELNSGKVDGDSYIPAEVDVSIRPGWFYHKSQEGCVRSPENLLKLWFTSNGSNAGFLLNLPPDRRGLVHENDAASLLELAKRLKSAFAKSLIEGADITASSELENAPVSAILRDDDSFFAPKGSYAEITVDLEIETEINTVVLREAFELGHRVEDFKVKALIDGEYKEILSGNMVGFRRAELISPIKTKSLKLEACGKNTPVIKFFGAYMINEDYINEKESTVPRENLATNEDAEILVKENGVDINLGGIKPFSIVRASSLKSDSFKILVFNGTELEEKASGRVQNGELEVYFSTPIDYAYRLFIEADITEKTKIEIL